MNNTAIMPCSITDGAQYDSDLGVGLPYHPMDFDDHGYLYEIVRTHRGWLVLRHSQNQSSDVLEHYFRKIEDAHRFINGNPESNDHD